MSFQGYLTKAKHIARKTSQTSHHLGICCRWSCGMPCYEYLGLSEFKSHTLMAWNIKPDMLPLRLQNKAALLDLDLSIEVSSRYAMCSYFAGI